MKFGKIFLVKIVLFRIKNGIGIRDSAVRIGFIIKRIYVMLRIMRVFVNRFGIVWVIKILKFVVLFIIFDIS